MLRHARALLHIAVPVAIATQLLLPAAVAHAEPAADLERRITRQSAELKALGEEYNEVNEHLKGTRAEQARHTRSLPTLERDRDGAEAAVQKLAAAEYKTAHLRGAAAVLGAVDRSTLLARLSTLDNMAESQQQQLDRLSTTRARYTAVQERLAAQVVRQAALRRELGSRRDKAEKQLDELYTLRRTAYGQDTEAGSTFTGAVPEVSGKAGVAVRFAYAAIGTPYVFADDGPDGYDCSGLTLAAWRAAGKSLPHNARMQWGVVSHLSRSELEPGDLVFYTNLTHIGMYVGGGKVIHAPTFGETVKISDIGMLEIFGYGRVR